MSIELIVMRLADMVRVHLAHQAGAKCCRCGEPVCIDPDAQWVLQKNYNVEVICQVCKALPDVIALAPDAEHEALESKREAERQVGSIIARDKRVSF